MHFKVFLFFEKRGTLMTSSETILHSGAELVGEQLPDCRAPAAESRLDPVANARMAPNEKEVKEHRTQHEAPESGREDDCNRQPRDDRQVLELLELQKRMFQSN